MGGPLAHSAFPFSHALCPRNGTPRKWQYCLGCHSGFEHGSFGRCLRLVETKVSHFNNRAEVTVNFEKQNSYQNSEVAGFLFLHNINHKYIERPPMPILNEMGGGDAIRKLIFVTTHWMKIGSDEEIEMEKELSQYLEPLLSSGARMDRFDMKTETAWGILRPLLRKMD